MGGDLGERNHPDNRKSPYMTFNLDNYEPVAPRLARWLEAAADPRVITTLIAYEPGKWCIFKTDLYEGEKTDLNRSRLRGAHRKRRQLHEFHGEL
jgi:hypothetical protein